MPTAAAEPIAIIAMGALFPGRGTSHGFVRDIIEGVDTLGPVPESHWRIEDYYDADPKAPDRTYGRRGGFLSPKVFDPMAFGIPPGQIASTDTAQLLSLLVADKVMRDVEAAGGPVDRERTSVVLGVASATELTAHMAGRLQRPVWEAAMREAGLPEDQLADLSERMSSKYTEWTEATFPGLLGNVVAGRIANRLDLGGSNYVTDAACASSLSALQVALHELRAGSSDLAFAGGADTLNDILMYMCFSKTPALSPTEDCRPFSEDADGTMLGEGIAMLALKRLGEAERDGDRIHAVIRGLGGASDGRATAIYAPLPSGQARALQRAYDQAGYGPETVGLVEAHGTGTKAGDKAELSGLTQVFDPESSAERPWCALGSVKSQIGHTKAAAGAASLIKAVAALNRRILPPTLKVSQPAEPLRGRTPFYVNTAARPWVHGAAHPRRASVSSFGFGGSNFHVTLEEYTGSARAAPERLLAGELFLLCATSAEALKGEVASVLEAADHEDRLVHLAEASHARFEPEAPVRASLVAATPEQLAERARRLLAAIDAGADAPPLPAEIAYSAAPAGDGKIAFLFSGQGSQYVGMGTGLARDFPAALDTWDEAARHPELAPVRLHELAFPARAFSEAEAAAQSERLRAMEHAQPAIAAVALAQLALLERAGIAPDMTGGHSFGEVMALHAAGVFDRSAALSIARARGQAMAEAAAGNPGAMLAVQASAEAAAPFLERTPALVLANDNGPDQIALSGPTEAIERAEVDLKSAGFTVKRLPVASAFHSPIVSGAIAPFADALGRQRLHSPRLPVYANASAAPYPNSPGAIITQLSDQIGQPVRFREMVEAMYADGARIFVEIGPGNVVTGLARRCLAGKDATCISLDTRRGDGTLAFLSGLGALAVAGYPVDMAGLLANMPAPPEPPPRPKLAVELTGANHGKPWPPAASAVETAKPPARAALPRRAEAPAPPPASVQIEDPVMPAKRSAEELTILREMFADITRAHTDYLRIAAEIAGARPEAGTGAQPDAPRALPPAAPAQEPARLNGDARDQAAAPETARSAEPVAAPPPAVSSAAPPMEAPAQAAPAPATAPAPAREAPRPVDTDTLAAVTAVIAEKTGYPADMLDPDMELEAELGVDSIKQVEILSHLREIWPHLPEIEPEQIADLSSIAAITAFIDGARPASPAPASDPAAPQPEPLVQTAPEPAPATNGHANGDMRETIRTVIAEKTGYPADILEDDMDLEAELGVDSIKQVEILSSLREMHPHLPEIEPEQIAELRTIRALSDFFG